MPRPHESSYRYIMPFGKYAATYLTFGQIYDLNRTYLDWVVGASGIPMEYREAASRTIQGLPLDGLGLPTQPPKFATPDKKPEMYALDADNGRVGAKMFLSSADEARFKLFVDGAFKNPSTLEWEFNKEHLLDAVEFFGGTDKVIPDAWVKYWYHQEKVRLVTLDDIRKKSDVELTIPGFIGELRPFQRVDIAFADAAGNRWVDADQPGLGKTPTAIGWALYKGGKTLCVVKKGLILQWVDRIKQFTGKASCVWSTDGIDGPKSRKFHVVNYDMVAKFARDLNEVGFQNLICDEATMIRNYKSKRTKAIMGSWNERKEYPGLNIPRVALLTGTPILKDEMDYFQLLHFADKRRFQNPITYRLRYQNATPEQIIELHQRAGSVVIRHLRRNVASEIPKKTRDRLLVDITPAERAGYERHLNELFKRWRTIGRPSAVQMPEIRNYLFELKLPRALDFVNEMIEAGELILSFSIQKAHVERLAAEFGKDAAFIHGDVPLKLREQYKDDLISGKLKVIFATLATAGMGMDGLQKRVSTTLTTDRWFLPGEHEQAEDRIVRIGQQEPTIHHYMTVPGTLDEDMAIVLEERQAIIDAAVDGQIPDAVASKARNTSIFGEVLARMSARRKEILGEAEMTVEAVDA